MAGNTTFFAKAADEKITWKDIFANVFKKHSKEDGERVFIAGTEKTTPHESRMIGEWQKPYLFSRAALYGFLFLGIMYAFYQVAMYVYNSQISAEVISMYGPDAVNNPEVLEQIESLAIINSIGGVLFPVIFVAALLPPLTELLLMWELNIPRNIPIYAIFSMLFLGGGLSLIITFVLGNFINTEAAHWAPLTEEPAKLLAACIFIWKAPGKYKYTLNGILIGAAIGAGFGSIETMKYGFNAMQQGGYFFCLDTVIFRGILAIGGHATYAALYVGALVMAKGSDKLQPRHFIDKRFLAYFAISFGLHFAWNYDGLEIFSFSIGEYPFTLKHILLIVVAWIMLLRLIKQGVLQCMRIPQITPASSVPQMQPVGAGVGVGAGAAVPYASSGEITLRGLSGMHKGTVFHHSGGSLVIGRDNRRANVVFPPDAPGISSIHCEITYQNGVIYITDKNSSNGTFLSDGTRLTPERLYPISRRSGFYLASRENMFVIE